MKITQHVKNIHMMSKEEYIAKHGQVIASTSSKNYAKNENWNWIEREKAKGNDLAEYREKMSKSVSEAIMSDPEERKRRSEMLGELNKRDDFRHRSSETAKVTSARPEIIETRTKRLVGNFKPTKPEQAIEMFIEQNMSDLYFKRNQQLFNKRFFTVNESHIRQIDFLSKSNQIMIEFDGGFHFKQCNFNDLEKSIAKDKELNTFAPKLGYVLIRVGASCFSYSKNDLSDDAKEKLLEAVKVQLPQVILIGNEYDEKYKKTRF